jgi:hypothetical protein
MRNYWKLKAQENETPQAYTSTDPTPTPIIYNYNQVKRILLVTHFVMPAGGDYVRISKYS